MLTFECVCCGERALVGEGIASLRGPGNICPECEARGEARDTYVCSVATLLHGPDSVVLTDDNTMIQEGK